MSLCWKTQQALITWALKPLEKIKNRTAPSTRVDHSGYIIVSGWSAVRLTGINVRGIKDSDTVNVRVFLSLSLSLLRFRFTFRKH